MCIRDSSNTGHQVTREYYVNNAGSQIDILGKSLYKRYLELFGYSIQLNKNEYPGDYLGRLVIGLEDGEVKVFGATIY